MDKERFVELAELPMENVEAVGELLDYIDEEADLNALLEMREALSWPEDAASDTSLVISTWMALALRMAALYSDKVLSAGPDDTEDILKGIGAFFNDKLSAGELRHRLEDVTFENKAKKARHHLYLGTLCAIEGGVDAYEVLPV